MIVDQENVEPINPCSLNGKRKAQQLAEDINKQLKVSKKPAAAPNVTPKSKAAPTKNTHAARGDALLPKTIYHNGKSRLEVCGLFTHDPVC